MWQNFKYFYSIQQFIRLFCVCQNFIELHSLTQDVQTNFYLNAAGNVFKAQQNGANLTSEMIKKKK